MKYTAPEMEMKELEVEDIMDVSQDPTDEPDLPTDEWD